MVKAHSKSVSRAPTRKVWRRIYLLQWREYHGLTVEKLAEMARVSPGLISLIENGKSAGSPETLEKLADALKISVGELIDICPRPNGSMLRTWVADKDRDRLERIIEALKDS